MEYVDLWKEEGLIFCTLRPESKRLEVSLPFGDFDGVILSCLMSQFPKIAFDV